MRIVAGTMKGKIFDAPSGDNTRPTTDRVREALFSSLYSAYGELDGAVVLDAFAGSGALGLEALSRGAKSALFFESDSKAASVLKRNIDSCGLEASRARIVRRDFLQAPPVGAADAFDVVFLDPPYSYAAVEVLSTIEKLGESGCLAQDAVVVYEHAQKSSLEVSEASCKCGFEIIKSKKYGKTALTFLRWHMQEAEQEQT